jgi:hypothetical protein
LKQIFAICSRSYFRACLFNFLQGGNYISHRVHIFPAAPPRDILLSAHARSAHLLLFFMHDLAASAQSSEQQQQQQQQQPPNREERDEKMVSLNMPGACKHP